MGDLQPTSNDENFSRRFKTTNVPVVEASLQIIKKYTHASSLIVLQDAYQANRLTGYRTRVGFLKKI